MKLLGSFLPKEDRFFGLLRSSTRNIVEVSTLLVDLMENYEDVPRKVAEIKRLEEVGDHIIHEIMRNLHRTFVTPLDREDIASLGERLDDVVDSIEEAARNMLEYGIPESTEAARQLAARILEAAHVLEGAMTKLHHRGAKLRELLPDTVELNRIENEADGIASRAVAQLFSEDYPPLEVMKWRDVYNQLETATDHCESAANVLEGIVLKNG